MSLDLCPRERRDDLDERSSDLERRSASEQSSLLRSANDSRGDDSKGASSGGRLERRAMENQGGRSDRSLPIDEESNAFSVTVCWQR